MKKAIPFLLAGALVFTFCKTQKQQESTTITTTPTKPSETVQTPNESAPGPKSARIATADIAVAEVPEEERVSVRELAVATKLMEIANSRWAGTTTEELSTGKSIYTGKCTRCHKNYPIEEFSEKKWLYEIDRMSPKAKLSEDEKLKLTKYILSYREMKAGASGN